MRRALPLLLILTTVAFAADPQPAIRKVLDDQAAAWNRGDLNGYMAGYWHSPDLTFFGGDSITKGWEPTLERYKSRYQSGGREMGKLDFSEVSVAMLGSDAALVRGRWHLKMSDGKEPKGVFTLIMKRMPEGWRIVHDHSS
jgi:ketosteroid isomerase-like protein